MAERLIQVAAAIALAFFLVWAARADPYVAKFGKDTVTLEDGPCLNGAVLKNVPVELMTTFQAGTTDVDGQHFDMCWAVYLDTSILVIMPDGGAYKFPMQAFKPLTKV